MTESMISQLTHMSERAADTLCDMNEYCNRLEKDFYELEVKLRELSHNSVDYMRAKHRFARVEKEMNERKMFIRCLGLIAGNEEGRPMEGLQMHEIRALLSYHGDCDALKAFSLAHMEVMALYLKEMHPAFMAHAHAGVSGEKFGW